MENSSNNQKVLCPKCNGIGYVINKGLAIGTFGMSLVCGLFCPDSLKVECPRCDGRGYIILR